jgi:hypothetical protein
VRERQIVRQEMRAIEIQDPSDYDGMFAEK